LARHRHKQGPNPVFTLTIFILWVLLPADMVPASIDPPSSSPSPSSSSEPAPVSALSIAAGTALQVNGDALTSTEVIASLGDKLSSRASSLSTEAFLNQAEPLIAESTMTHIRDRLVYQHAKNKLEKIDSYEMILQAELDRERRRILAKYGGSEARARAELTAQHSSIEDKLRNFERRIIVASFQQAHPIASQPITRNQMLQYYRTHLDDKYRRKPIIQFQLIDIQVRSFLPQEAQSDPDMTPLEQARSQAAQSAHDALQEINDGADFAEVVRKYSHGFRKSHDGVWEPRNPDAIRASYQPVVTALTEVDIRHITPVIPTEDRFFIAKLLERHPSETVPFAQAQSEINRILADQQWQQYWRDISLGLWQKATIGDLKHFVRTTALMAYQQFHPIPR